MKLVIMCGAPKVGKSTYVSNHFPDANIISPDNIRMGLFGTWFNKNLESLVWDVCERLLKSYLKDPYARPKKSDIVVIDATNLSTYQRNRWIKIAKGCRINRIEAIVIDTPTSIARKRNSGDFEKGYKPVPSEAFEEMHSCFREPKTEEGFTNIIRVKGYR